MVKEILKFKVWIVCFIVIFLSSKNSYAISFNDDLQKFATNYVYFNGFENDKIIHDIENNSWSIVKGDGKRINLKGKYLDYSGIVKGKYYNFNDDYYRFTMKSESYECNKSTYFVYVDRNGLESAVEKYSYANPTLNENYFVVTLYNGGRTFAGLYHKYNKSEIILPVYDSINYNSDLRITACKNQKYGIIDIDQNIIIPFKYDELRYVNDNFIIAKTNDNYGVININNKRLLSFEYDEIYTSSEGFEGYAKILKDNRIGLLKSDDAQIIIPMQYQNILSVNNELLIAQLNDKQGVVDLKNKVVIPFIYDSIMSYDNYFIAYKDGLIGLLNSDGKEILPFNFIYIEEIKSNIVTTVLFDENNERKYAVYDTDGNELVPPIYDYINYNASDNYMIVKNKGVCNLVNKATNKAVLQESEYSHIKYINDKYFAAGYGDSYCIVNFLGQKLTKVVYDRVGLINIDGEELIAAELNKSELPRAVDYFKQTMGPSSWAREEVANAIDKGLVPQRYQSAYTFNITRSEFASIITAFIVAKNNTSIEEIIEANNIDVINPAFTDEFNKEIAVCYSLGIVKGRGNKIFDGQGEITREEAAVMLANLSKYLRTYSDAENMYLNDKRDISSWADPSVNYVLKNNIMQGMGYNRFSPKANLTKEQSYIIMYRMLQSNN